MRAAFSVVCVNYRWYQMTTNTQVRSENAQFSINSFFATKMDYLYVRVCERVCLYFFRFVSHGLMIALWIKQSRYTSHRHQPTNTSITFAGTFYIICNRLEIENDLKWKFLFLHIFFPKLTKVSWSITIPESLTLYMNSIHRFGK